MAEDIPWEALFQQAVETRRMRYRMQLTAEDCRTWYLDGHKIVPIKYAYRMRQDVPGIQFLAFPKTGHAPQEERPSETAARLLLFLSAIK